MRQESTPDITPAEYRTALEALREQHEAAELRLAQLDERLWLSADEQVELARLKKHKLRLKDEMRALAVRP